MSRIAQFVDRHKVALSVVAVFVLIAVIVYLHYKAKEEKYED